MGVCIVPGVTIGEGTIVGAGSVVTRDLEPFSVAVGNPAKSIRSRRTS
jgi:acetyltransferase-like isoleucine patch superfamily enzyme